MANGMMSVLKKLVLCACVVTALSCGEREDMLDFAISGGGAAGKLIYINAAIPNGLNQDIFLLIADDQKQRHEYHVAYVTNDYGFFHVSEDGFAFFFSDVSFDCYVNSYPYTFPWFLMTTPFDPSGSRIVSSERGTYLVDNVWPSALYRFELGWQLVGAFNNNTAGIQGVDLPRESDFIYTIESTTGIMQRYGFSSGFETRYSPTYTPAFSGNVIYIHRGKNCMYVGTDDRLYFCSNPTGNVSEQYNRLGSDISALSPLQAVVSYCVSSDESMIFASTTESSSPYTMHIYLRNGGSWSEILSFPGPGTTAYMHLFDMGEGRLVLWIGGLSSSAGIYVFDYKKMKLNRVLINPAYYVLSVVVN
jgi:hypothetical protein